MGFLVGIGLVVLGAFVSWGGISGRLAKMAAAVVPSSGAQTTSFSPPDTGFQQFGGLTISPGSSSFLASASLPSSGDVGSASIPSWESSSLSSLAQQGSLFGVPASVLAGIDQAESQGQGGAINSSGYGGFFGLGVGKTYPNSNPVTSGLLTGTDPSAFAAQAEIAAAEFASLLGQTGGNTYQAEQIYQGGSSEGVGVFQSLGVPETVNIGAVA